MKGGEWLTNLCLIDRPETLRAAAGSHGSGGCRPGASGRSTPVRRGIVLGCGLMPIAGERFQLVGYRSGRGRDLCIDTVLVDDRSAFGCGNELVHGGGAIDIDGKRISGDGDTTGIDGTLSRRAVAVAIRYSRNGVEYRRAATVVHPPPRVRRKLGIRHQFGRYEAEAPKGAKVLGVEARDGSGKLIGTAPYPPRP